MLLPDVRYLRLHTLALADGHDMISGQIFDDVDRTTRPPNFEAIDALRGTEAEMGTEVVLRKVA